MSVSAWVYSDHVDGTLREYWRFRTDDLGDSGAGDRILTVFVDDSTMTASTGVSSNWDLQCTLSITNSNGKWVHISLSISETY